MELELIANFDCVTGEGPLWHPDEQCVYWTDIPQGKLFRYEPKSGKSEQVYSGDQVGGFTIQEDGALLLFMNRGGVALWQDDKLTALIDQLPGEENSRFNDVVADPAGRVFCGTMPSKGRLGSLYRLDLDGSIHKVLDSCINVSNGLGFTPDRKRMYYTESMTKKIYLFDYDEKSGALSNQRVFVDSATEPGVPDGMTVDAGGYVWSARWDGFCLQHYSPTGRELQRIMFPTKKVSCPTFGGPDYMDMYVTTAGGHDKADNGPAAGALYRLRIGVKGVPEFRSRVKITE
jgi:D-xylono/L-arabinono-1,4-lactonase